MNKIQKILVNSALALSTLLVSNAQAAATSAPFNVNITLTSACILSAIADVTFAYTSLGGAVNSTGGNFTVTCTNNLPYTLGLQQGNGAAVPPGSTSLSNITDNALQLTYSLSVPAGSNPGTGMSVAHTITGSMAANQAGSCATATCDNFSANNPTGAPATNRIHTLIVNF